MPNLRKRSLLLTGRPGVGKTFLINELIPRPGARAGGFYTEEVRRQGARIGFSVQALDGSIAILASTDHPGSARVGRYGVDLQGRGRVGATPSSRPRGPR